MKRPSLNSRVIVSICLLIAATNVTGITDSITKFSQSYLENCDAYYVSRKITLEYPGLVSVKKNDITDLWNSAPNQIESIHYRIKINTSKGIEKYAFITIPRNRNITIKQLDVVTIKENGTLVKFDSSLLFTSEIPEKLNNNDSLQVVKYVIPGVEPGDEIDISMSLGFIIPPKDYYYGFMFLNSEMPTVHSQMEFIVPEPYYLKYTCFNGMSFPSEVHKDSANSWTFSSDSLMELGDVSQAILAKELPCIYFSVTSYIETDNLSSWMELYNSTALRTNINTNYPSQKDLEIVRWAKKQLKNLHEEDTVKTIEAIVVRANEYFKVRDENFYSFKLEKNKINKKQKEVDRDDLYTLYTYIFDHFKIDYYFAFCRDKYLGDIYMTNPNNNEFTHLLLVFYGKDSAINIICPHYFAHPLYMNEIPMALNGTTAVIINNKKTEMAKRKHMNDYVPTPKDLNISNIYLKIGNENTNYFYRQRYIRIKDKSSISNYRSILNFSGMFSNLPRAQYKELLKTPDPLKAINESGTSLRDTFEIDSVFERRELKKFPFQYSVEMDGRIGSFYNKLNDSLISIPLEGFLQAFKQEFNSRKRYYDLVIPFAFSHIQDLTVEFPCEVEILNTPDVNIQFKNDIGHCELTTSQIDKNKIYFKANYSISKEIVRKESFFLLEALNAATDNIIQSKILVRGYVP